MTETPARRRDAAATRRALLDGALVRFARDGYGRTTVRQLADDAGVNVALINRYFDSKEGLFEACVKHAVTSLKASTEGVSRVDRIAGAIARHAAGTTADGPPPALLLLLRSSGDPETERVRLDVLAQFSEKLARAAGWSPELGDDELLLRAQLVLATAVGITVLRSTGGDLRLDPLASAGPDDLAGPLAGLVAAVLGPGLADEG